MPTAALGAGTGRQVGMVSRPAVLSTSTLEPRSRAYTLGAMVARVWSGLMCLETQGPRGGRQTLDLDGVAEVLTHGQLESTHRSEDPRSKPRLRLVAARHARDQPLGRNVATGHPATDGPEMKRGRRRAGRTNTGPNAGGVSARRYASGETGF